MAVEQISQVAQVSITCDDADVFIVFLRCYAETSGLPANLHSDWEEDTIRGSAVYIPRAPATQTAIH